MWLLVGDTQQKKPKSHFQEEAGNDVECLGDVPTLGTSATGTPACILALVCSP